jgi:hypothetical protein
MVKSSKEFFSPKTLIPPGPAGYSHIAKVSQGCQPARLRYMPTQTAVLPKGTITQDPARYP